MTATSAIYMYNENQARIKHRSNDCMKTQTVKQQLDVFLREHQQQAYAIAVVSVQQQADALDVVQDAMLAFVKHYSEKPVNDWRPLFYRVLQNKITDYHRRQKSWLRHFFSGNDKNAMAEQQASQAPSPLQQANHQVQGNEMIKVIQKLPPQQQQVVLYRHWQELSVEETAQIMQISTGSVKTHLFRAKQKIKSLLGAEHE